MKLIETSKGRFIVLDEYELDIKEKKGITYVYNNRHLIDWHNRIKISEITEEQASEIIGFSELILDFNNGKPKYLKRLESLYCILKSKEIEITNNTCIFKV